MNPNTLPLALCVALLAAPRFGACLRVSQVGIVLSSFKRNTTRSYPLSAAWPSARALVSSNVCCVFLTEVVARDANRGR